ncbi:MAG TPA: class I SAM-dependent methyltransferase [Silvibacterium sp.]|nr:class I SAM-dependent methyltransferase [Silvibacterium sp.]
MSTLEKLKDHWETLAERDALHAILTDSRKRVGRWQIAEFMATGVYEIETVLSYLAELGCLPEFSGTALDFGCGVGRLTQALARRFNSTVGVDISHRMIRTAESFNRFAHCRYLVSASALLPFADASFSFIYSNILQHVPRRIATRYLREFIRVLEPGGVLVFGVQDCFAAPDVPSLFTRIRHILNLRSRFRVALGLGTEEMQIHCLPERIVRRNLNPARVVDIQFTNTAAKDFNGRLVYLHQPPASGYVAKQYCAVKIG